MFMCSLHLPNYIAVIAILAYVSLVLCLLLLLDLLTCRWSHTICFLISHCTPTLVCWRSYLATLVYTDSIFFNHLATLALLIFPPVHFAYHLVFDTITFFSTMPHRPCRWAHNPHFLHPAMFVCVMVFFCISSQPSRCARTFLYFTSLCSFSFCILCSQWLASSRFVHLAMLALYDFTSRHIRLCTSFTSCLVYLASLALFISLLIASLRLVFCFRTSLALHHFDSILLLLSNTINHISWYFISIQKTCLLIISLWCSLTIRLASCRFTHLATLTLHNFYIQICLYARTS